MADEAYGLYPENPQHLERAKGRADHEFFHRFGAQMPSGDWNHKGTKQGIYMMGPDAEFLEGRFAASGEAADIHARLVRALERWEDLKRSKGYANKAIQPKPWSPPPGVEGELVLRVNLRDLPRGPGDQSGSRLHEIPTSGMWLDFVKWAWNENWVAIERSAALVPRGDAVQQVDQALVRRVVREVMVDNVRGQAPEWRESEVKSARLEMWKLEEGKFAYRGSFSAEAGSRGYDAKMYGEGAWDGTKFTSLDIVAIGMRRGIAQFNQRENDPGPAPMGVTLSLTRQ